MLGNKIGRFVLDKVDELGGNPVRVDFTDDGEPLPVVIITGPNGCGKTTLLNAVYDVCKSNNTPVLSSTNMVTDIVYRIETALKDYIYKTISSKNIETSIVYEQLNYELKDVLDIIGIQFLVPVDTENKSNYCYRTYLTKKVTFRVNNGETTKELRELSNGIKSYLINVVYMMLINFKDGIILLDNPDCGQHIVVQKKMIELYEKYARDNNCQIIIATHSPFLINDRWEIVREMFVENGSTIVK